jgi:response regulator RpfG family c-di-GMP phosphodiesterase
MQGKRIKILLVDDDEDDFILTRELLKEFEHYSYSLSWVDNYQDGLEAMLSGDYDIFLVDYQLGHGTGLELLREATAKGSRVPIILLTGRGGYEVDLQAMAAGAMDYLVKDKIQGALLERSIRYALERKQAEEAIRLEAAKAEALLRIASRLNARLDLKAVLEAVCEESCLVTKSSASSIHIYNSQEDSYHLGAVFGLKPEIAEKVPHLLSMSKGKIIPSPGQFQLPHNLSKIENLPNELPSSGRGITTIISLGIVCEGEAFGALNIYTFDRERTYSEEELALLKGLLDQATLAISNARLYEEEQARNKELAAVAHLTNRLAKARDSSSMPSLVESEIKNLLNCDWAGVIPFKMDLLNEPGQEAGSNIFDAIDPSQNIAPHLLSQAYYDRKTLVLPEPGNRADGCQPFAIVPLQAEADTIGLLAINRLNQDPFSKADIQLLTSLGMITGNAMYRARLFEDAQRRLQYTQALHEIDLAIASTLDLKLTLKTALQQTIQQLGVDAAAVFLLNKETGYLEYSISWGFRTKSIQRNRIKLGKGFSGRVALDKKVWHKENITNGEAVDSQPFPDGEGFFTYIGTPLISKGEVKGVLEIYHRERLTPDSEWTGFLKTLAGQIAIAIDNALLFEGLQQSNADLVRAYDTALEGWSRALDLRDKETEGHTQRVTHMTLRLASAMGIDKEELNHVRRGAILHDIGKMAIPDRILLKPGPLNEDEWDIMRRHSDYAYHLLAPIPFLQSSLDIPYCHHERWDGTGYPRRLKGEEIPLAARIFAVIDVWDALRSNRPYRKAWSMKKAREYIREQTGRHFDPKVGRTFLELVDQNAI